MNVSIYIKSRFRGNPRGAGEAAAIIEYIDQKGNKHTREQQIEIEKDTRNALELKICTRALNMLLKPCEVTIYINNNYLCNAYTWLSKWQQNGWKKANKHTPANIGEWKQFYMLTQINKVQFNPYNNQYETELEKILGGTDK